MSYPNVGGYNPNYQGGHGASAPGGFGNFPGGQPGGYGPGQPGGYPGGYPGGGHAAAPPQVNPDVQRWFSTVDRDHSGKISAKELQAALVNGQGRNFSDQACTLMIGMFDHDKSGTIDVQEFQQLYNYINQWIATFRTYDRDNSGHIEEAELTQAFQQMGFRFSPEFTKFLITKSDLQNHAKITVDQFIVLCVQIQRFTDLWELEVARKANVKTNANGLLDREALFDFRKKKRKLLVDDDGGVRVKIEQGIDQAEEVDNAIASISECTVGSDCETDEAQRTIAERDVLILDNLQLTKENSLLQETNHSLEIENARLKEEAERLRSERDNALDLSNWLTSAKEIAQNLSRQSKSFSRRRDTQGCRGWDGFEADPSQDSDPNPEGEGESEGGPFLNGGAGAGAVIVKTERLDEETFARDGDENGDGFGYCYEERAEAEGDEYHTPLLTFDQVEVLPKGVPAGRLGRTAAAVPADPPDDLGRDQLLHPQLVDGVCELCPGSRIYVSIAAMENIINKRTHSSVARSCLEAIFKTKYLLLCSVQGNVAKGPYGKPEFQRPCLYRPAVDAILRFSRCLAERNSWKIEEMTTIKKQMNTRLSELRNVAKSRNHSQSLSLVQITNQNQNSDNA